MIRSWLGSVSVLFPLVLVVTLLTPLQAENLFSSLDKRALKAELVERDAAKVERRLQQWATDSKGRKAFDYTLCKRFVALQSSDEWRSHRAVLNEVMGEALAEMVKGFPDKLKATHSVAYSKTRSAALVNAKISF